MHLKITDIFYGQHNKVKEICTNGSYLFTFPYIGKIDAVV